MQNWIKCKTRLKCEKTACDFNGVYFGTKNVRK